MIRVFKAPDGSTGMRQGNIAEGPIPDGSEIVEFDEATNPELLDALCGRNVLWQDIDIERGEIVIRKQPAVINPPEPVKPTAEQELLEWARNLRARLATATTFAELKIEDAKHPPLPEKVTAEAEALSEAKAR